MSAVYISIRRALGVFFLAGLVGHAAPAAAESNTEKELATILALEMHRQFGTNAQLDAAANKAYGVQLSPQKAEIARRSMRALLFNEAMPAYMAKLLAPVYHPGITQREVASATLEGIAQLQVKGLARLSSARQASFVGHMLDMVTDVSPADCKALFLGQFDTQAGAVLERRHTAGLPLGKFEAVSNMYRDAAQAELTGYPDARIINAQQAKLAEQVFEAAAAKRITAQLSQTAIARVNADSASAPAGEVCTLLKATLEGMLDMPDPYRSWQLTRFAESMQ